MLRPRIHRAFTLVELLVVMAIVALLLSIAVPRYMHSVEQSRETMLRANLALTRHLLDQFYEDNGKYPDALDELVSKKYVRRLPIDPVTGSSATWVPVAPPDPAQGAVFDVHSGAPGNGLDGTPYGQW
ncbi:type IV pilin protein [Massilia horti]|uniref:Prepilin-type N-terminal cleavage/methylation domain-containing protein n=1 Tax=Massilia horti TaxID=2562153 RepID=A0A4Y9SZX7_9BURK|nr:prepilin-type N-terminal cleavage/methylation domain-containing protein [Massilia horti]TFW32302.1 prepilin-type N-terminal cleavage/methylation domain-containing protein [Massilia horti]